MQSTQNIYVVYVFAKNITYLIIIALTPRHPQLLSNQGTKQEKEVAHCDIRQTENAYAIALESRPHWCLRSSL
jgi:hypothetical protein